jgi:hypothetical protein
MRRSPLSFLLPSLTLGALLVTAAPLAAQEFALRPATFAEIAAERRAAAPTPDALRLGPSLPEVSWSALAPAQDTLLPWTPQPKNFGLAVAEVGLSWLVPWAFNYYVRDAEFAHVGPDSWFENLTNPWVWDDNNFITNQFGHPYQGHMYFTSGRANGFNFWASSGFAAFGAWGWEVFGETHPPAPNDLFATTLGGIAMGEATYRLATLLTDNTARGAERTWREIGSTVLNPVYGFNRLIRGEMSRHWENPPDRVPSRFAVTILGGVQSVVTELPPEDVSKTGQVVGSAELLYGNPFTDDFKKPFSTMTARIDLASKNDFAIQDLHYEGSLVGRHFGDEEGRDKGYMLVSDRFQYFKNPAFEYGGMTLYGQMGRLWHTGENWSMALNGGPGWVMFAATPSNFEVGEGRDYDFTTGAGLTGAYTLLWRQRSVLRAGFTSGWLFTVNGTGQRHDLTAATTDLRWPVAQRMGIGLAWLGYWRASYYESDPDIHQHSNQARLYASWVFGNSRM